MKSGDTQFVQLFVQIHLYSHKNVQTEEKQVEAYQLSWKVYKEKNYNVLCHVYNIYTLLCHVNFVTNSVILYIVYINVTFVTCTEILFVYK